MSSQESDRDSTDTDARVTRRRLLVSGAGVWTTATLAGCSYITDPGPPDSGDGSDGDDGGSESDGDDGGSGGDGTTTPVPTGTATVTNQTTTTDDTSTPTGTPTPTQTECQNRREFAPGMEIALNVGVYDSESGDYLGADAIDSVTVEFPESAVDPLELSWSGPHEEYVPDGWGGKIETDPDIESGTHRYEITIDAEETFDETVTITDQFTII